MATPGAAGVAVLMYQANPDLSPFDIRNMYETSTYRQCHYMLANEPYAEDLIPKNRQNNVYGHGHVNAQPSVEEAANYVYELSMSLNVTLNSEYGVDNRVHRTRRIDCVNLEGGVQRVQWRTWDMRDNWMDLSEFTIGEQQFQVTHDLLVDRLRFLPNNTVEGDQVILVRAISGDQASTNLAMEFTSWVKKKLYNRILKILYGACSWNFGPISSRASFCINFRGYSTSRKRILRKR